MEKQTNISISAARKSFHKQVIFGTSFSFLTSGVFLSGLAIYMGASDLLVSYIYMITNICGISILFFSSIIGRCRSFKKITIALTICSKLTTLTIVLIPLLFRGKSQIAVFIPILIIAFTLQAQTTVTLNNWMITFVKEGHSGQYIAKRQTFVLVVTAILSLVGGRLLDVMAGAYIGFAILFLLAFAMLAVEIVILLRIPDSVQEKPAKIKTRFSSMVLIPIKHRPFIRFVMYIFFFHLLLSICDSFTVVYMMRYLELSYVTTTAMQMIYSLPQIFLLGIWGKISDKKGHQFVLTTSVWFFLGQTIFFALSNSYNFYVLLPAAFLFSAIANSGYIISVFNRRYELMPKEGRILYDNFYTACIGLAFILGPFTGGMIKKLYESSSLITNFIQHGNIRSLYVLSTIGILILQIIMCLSKRRYTADS